MCSVKVEHLFQLDHLYIQLQKNVFSLCLYFIEQTLFS